MILDSKTEQFRLAEDGRISWQEQPTNPLPGEPIARLVKGVHILKPEFELLDVDLVKNVEPEALKTKLNEWFAAHIQSVMEDLVALDAREELCEEAAGIAQALYDALGILPREEVEHLIDGLDTETRRPLRQKKVKLGPILIFLYTLNKPAAVRLRALLWSLYHGRDLPAQVPADGMVSVAVDPAQADPVYYRAIGYPVYGRRAIRVDMLDRLISAVYDSSDKGKFTAKHEMAEWLGCSIEDLYLVLEAMGHKKIYDPADEKTPEVEEAVSAPALEAEGEASESPEDSGAEDKPAEEAQAEQPQAKPELAVFRLKRGKANQKGAAGRKPAAKKAQGQGKASDDSKLRKKPHKKKPKRDEGPRVISTGPEKKPEDSPFAILEQLKK